MKYHDNPAMSSHKLADFDRSPSLYYRKHVLREMKDRPSERMVFGSLTHAVVLEGPHAVARDFVVIPEEFQTPGGAVSTAKPAKAWMEANLTDGRRAITGEMLAKAHKLNGSVRKNCVAAGLLSEGEAEVEMFSAHPPTGVPVKGKADWVNPSSRVGVDLKTCQNVDEFAASVHAYGYDRQAAFYSAPWLFDLDTFWFVAVETEEPYRCRVFRLTPRLMAQATDRVEAAFLRFADCRARDEWEDPAEVVEIDVASPSAA